MALFKISKGLKANLPSAKTAGHCWYTIDDSLFYIDYEDENGVVQRKALNAKDAESLSGASLATILNSSDLEIPTSKSVLDALDGKSDTTHKHDDAYDVKGAAEAVQKNLDAVYEEIKEELSVQSDWNQNDPDATDYIKNRTHWVEDAQLETIFDGTVKTSGPAVVKMNFIEMDEPLVVGDEYLVTLNDTQYTLTAALDAYDCAYIGDNTYEFTTIPFRLSNDSTFDQMFEAGDNGTWNLKVQHNNIVVHQLDEKFIPDTIARVHNWTQIYDSGAITKNVNAFSSINLDGYTNIMVAIKVVNTTSSSGNTGGAINFVGKNNGKTYAFRNILPDLIKNTSGTTGGMAIFKIIDGFIICENAMRSTSADNMLSTTEASGADNLIPVGGGVIACTDQIAYFYVGNTNSSNTHYYGAGSRVVVWGCKA